MNPIRQFSLVAVNVLLVLLTMEISISPGQTPSAASARPPFADLAGSYYRGDGLGLNQSLEVKGDGDYSFTWSGCLGTYSSSRGRISRSGGAFDLQTTFEDPRNRVPVAEGNYLPIRWGNRQYLIPAAGLMSFVNAINLGSEPRDGAHGAHYLRAEDWKIPVAGLPDLPEPYRGYLLKKPEEGSVLRLGDEEGTFDVAFGPRSGVVPSMTLVAEGEEAESFCEMEVVSVSGTVAVARPEDFGACRFLRPGAPVFTSLSSLPSPMYQRPGKHWEM